jgi:hypothetical protein
VQMVVEEGSFLKVAVDRELAKAAWETVCNNFWKVACLQF